MNKKLKRSLIEFGIFGGIIAVLFLTGLHTEVFGFIQRGVLKTGLMNPDVEERRENDGVVLLPEADFRMNLINSRGDKVSMADLRGRVIFLNLWATWCPPCIAEMPGINGLYNEVKDEDIVFLMLSLDKNFQKVKDFNKKKEYDFEVYTLDGGIPQMYNSQSIPTTYIIDKEGRLALTHEGMADYNNKEFKTFLLDLMQ